ncbi:MAG: iron-containing alcohol dehydrogenase, partial [Erysipelotrichaceae bacterium]|nr:iron-containing alcohol dehydrogenase [Erysipelotrichaceae bacterium]
MALERYSIKMPKAVYSGTDSLDNVTAIIRSTKSRKVAAFTDKGIRKLGLFDLVERRIREAGVDYEIFDDLPAEPTYMAVQNVIDQFKNTGCDLIVACGGGSVMDAAKLASVLVTDEYTVKDL